MKLPKLGTVPSKTVYIDNFSGLTSPYRSQDGDVESMQSIDFGRYPKLGSRPYRYKIGTVQNLQAFQGFSKLTWVAGNKLYIDGTQVATLATAGKRLLASNGYYTLIYPDKKCYVHADGTLKSLFFSATYGSVRFSDGFLEGEAADANAVQLPNSVSGSVHVGDGISIYGCYTHEENDGTRVVRGISPDGKTLYFDEGSFVLENGSAYTEQGPILVERHVPDAQFIFSCQNRFWCCNGNTVYASKPGDPFNWSVYDGISSDSFSVELGSYGDVTGACEFDGYPTFFKKDSVSRIYGTRPGNYQVLTRSICGVDDSAGDSLCAIGNYLYYQSPQGITVWNGSSDASVCNIPVINTLLGPVAGTDGRNYWISGTDVEGEPHTYVLHTDSGKWFCYDDVRMPAMAYCGYLYLVDPDGNVWMEDAKGDPPLTAVREASFNSEVVFAPVYCRSNDALFLESLSLRVVVEEAVGTVAVSVEYEDGSSQDVGFCSGIGEHRIRCLLLPNRSDSFRLRIRSYGAWYLHSLQYRYSSSDGE